ncbi:MAG: GNAT family N-acetyltransferase [Planctomycetes bacterium]|nr:GNAT family N-acetyltransferase [Planctomycetota bacterium]
MNAPTQAAELSIRPGRLDDLAQIVEFNHRLALESENKSLDHATLTKGVEALLRDPRLGRYFVAVAGDPASGPLVGQVMTTEEWSDWRNGLFWWLQSVYVQADWRGRGVFRLLLNKVVAQGKAAGVIGLRLYVEDHNERALATYRRSGFADAGYRVLERLPL